MGFSHWSDSAYQTRQTHRRRTKQSAFTYDQQVRSSGIARVHPQMDPYCANRESRDSAQHPNSVAVAVIFDVTGPEGAGPSLCGYGFNQGHATAYADVSYRSAYLHAHYPAAFLAARLANYGGFHHPAIYIAEAHRLGIKVRPPHVNHSRCHFTLAFVENDHARPVLWMGLGQVRSLRRRTVAAMIKQRREEPFMSWEDLCRWVDLQRKELTHLIQCGALDGLGASRTALLAEAGENGTQRLQLAFAFDEPAVEAETPAERLR